MDVRGQRILLFGDSLTHHGHDAGPEVWDVDQGSNRQSGQPGDLLGSMLLEAGAEAVRIDARVSRSAANFFGREASQALLSADAAFRPSIVFIILGTNDIGLNMAADAQAFTQLKEFFEGAGATVWAIGPFTYNAAALNIGAQPVVAMMQDVFGRRFIDGRPLSVQEGRGGDGVHFGAQSAAATAANMLAEIQSAGGVLDIKRSWPGFAIGALAVLAGAMAFQWWRRGKGQLADIAIPARDFSKVEAEKEIKRLITDTDPSSMEIAQDLALQNEIKLSELFAGAGSNSGMIKLTPGSPMREDGPVVTVSWKAKPGSNALGRCMGEFHVRLNDKRVGGPAIDLPSPVNYSGQSRRFEQHYQGGEDYCRRAVVADAWAIAKKIKDVQAAYMPEGNQEAGTVKYHYAERAIKDALDKDNSEPAELFGLAAHRPVDYDDATEGFPEEFRRRHKFGTLTRTQSPGALDVAEDFVEENEFKITDLVNEDRSEDQLKRELNIRGSISMNNDRDPSDNTFVRWTIKPTLASTAEQRYGKLGRDVAHAHVDWEIAHHSKGDDARFIKIPAGFARTFKNHRELLRAITADAWAGARAIQALPPDALPQKIQRTFVDALYPSEGRNIDRKPHLFGLKKSKMAIGAIVARVDNPTERYSVVSAPSRDAFRLLPYQRSGKEVIIMRIGKRWTDGTASWSIVDG